MNSVCFEKTKQIRIQFIVSTSGKKVSVLVKKPTAVYSFERAPKVFRVMAILNNNGLLELRCIDSLDAKHAITIGKVLAELLGRQFDLGKHIPLSKISNTLRFKENLLCLAESVGVIKFIDSEDKGYIIIGKKRIPVLTSRIAREDVLKKYLEETKIVSLHEFLRRAKVVYATLRVIKEQIMYDQYQEFLNKAYNAWEEGDVRTYSNIVNILERLGPLYFTINFNYGYTHFYSYIPESEYVDVIHPFLCQSLREMESLKLYKFYEKLLEVLT